MLARGDARDNTVFVGGAQTPNPAQRLTGKELVRLRDAETRRGVRRCAGMRSLRAFLSGVFGEFGDGITI